MKNKLKIISLLVIIAVMSVLCWNNIKQTGLTSLEADSLNVHSVFYSNLIKISSDNFQYTIENIRYIYFGIGLLALILLYSIASKFNEPSMSPIAVLLSGSSVAWVSSFQQISVLAFSIFSVLLLQKAFAFVYPKANKNGIILYSIIAFLSILLSPSADFLIGIHILLIIIKLISRTGFTFSRISQLIIIFIIFIPFWIWQNQNVSSNLSTKTLLFICPITIILLSLIFSFLLKLVFNYIYKLKSKSTKLPLLILYFIVIIAIFLFWASFQYKAYYAKLNQTTENNLVTGINFLNKVVRDNDKLLIISQSSITNNLRLKYYLPEFIKNHPKLSVSKINPFAWKNFRNILESFTNDRIWITGAYFQKPDFSTTSKWKATSFPFAMPIVLAETTSRWNEINYYNFLEKAISVAPDNLKINCELLHWYINASSNQLTYNLEKGYALKDLSYKPIFDKIKGKWHHAVINILYAWSDVSIDKYNTTNYPIYNNFALSTLRAGLDIERAVYIYRLYATKMLENNMPKEAKKITNDSKKLEKENAFINRISAQIVQKINPDDLNKIEELNKKAIKLHKENFSETFLEAKYAIAILKKKQAEYDEALKEIMSLLEYVKSTDFIPLNVRTNNTKKGIKLQNDWIQQQIEREGQFNAFIAEIHNEKNDYKTAIKWYQKNTSGKFDKKRNLIARRQISRIFEENGLLKDAYMQFKVLANNSTSLTEKLVFLIDGAQLYVNQADSITVYDKWLELKRIIFNLPSEERSRWIRNKKYKRIINHLQSRMQLDIREQLIIDLIQKSANTNSGWFLQQVGQLYRCKQQYANAEKSFYDGMNKKIDFADNYLDAAMLQYKLLRFKKSEKIFEKFKIKHSLSNSFTIDWRYQILESFFENDNPPKMSSLINWADENKSLFGNQEKYHNFKGNIYATYNNFELATNEFYKGIATNEFFLENYLDLGYQLCLKNDSENGNVLLDEISNINVDNNIRNKINDDWRFIQLYFITVH